MANILKKFIIMIQLIILVSSQKACNVTFDAGKTSDSRIINSYSPIFGGMINLSYSDPAVQLMTQKAYLGSIRYLGGFGNEWNISNGSYSHSCNSTCYNSCGGCPYEYNLDALPKDTFSATNFYKYIINSNKLKVKRYTTFILNIWTMPQSQWTDQLYSIYNQFSSIENFTYYFEFGNELYHPKYQTLYPNASVYMQTIIPLINATRTIFKNKNFKILVVGDYNLGRQWNTLLLDYIHYFDGITIHDMTLSNSSLPTDTSKQNQISYISSYGRYSIQKYTNYSQNILKKPIYITAYASHIENDTFSFSVLHPMFGLSYISSAVCNVENIHFLSQFVLSSQYETSSGKVYGYYQSSFKNGIYTNDTKNTTFMPLGQLLAQLGYISMAKNDKMFCLKSVNCPEIDIPIHGDILSCVYGIGFGNQNDENSIGIVLVNSCNFSMSVNINMNQITSLSQDITLMVSQYTYQQHGYEAAFIDCGLNEIWDPKCAVVVPMVYNETISKQQSFLSIEITPFSVIMAHTL